MVYLERLIWNYEIILLIMLACDELKKNKSNSMPTSWETNARIEFEENFLVLRSKTSISHKDLVVIDEKGLTFYTYCFTHSNSMG